MNNGITIPMLILDAIPVAMFFYATIILMKDLYNKMNKVQYALLSTGSIMLFFGAIMKLMWKLLYALEICDFTVLSEAFFPLQAVGFLFISISLIGMLSSKKKKKSKENNVNAIATIPVVTTHMPFLLVTLLGMTTTHVCLAVIAVKMKKKLMVLAFVGSFIFMLAECIVGSMFNGTASMHWIAEVIHLVAEICLLAGVLGLHKANLADEKALG